jgi:hypothetical protein
MIREIYQLNCTIYLQQYIYIAKNRKAKNQNCSVKHLKPISISNDFKTGTVMKTVDSHKLQLVSTPQFKNTNIHQISIHHNLPKNPVPDPQTRSLLHQPKKQQKPLASSENTFHLAIKLDGPHDHS